MHDQKIKTIQSSDLKDLVTSMYDIQHTRIILANRFDSTSTNIALEFVKDLESAEKHVKNVIKDEVKQYSIHEWVVAQKGISYDMAAQMIGLIQDISKFDNVSSLWSYSGMGVIKVCNVCGKKYIEPKDRPAWILKTAGRLMEQYKKKIVKEGRSDFNVRANEMICSCDAKTPNVKSVGQKRLSGTLLDYNPKLKSLCWRFGKQFVMQGDFYRKLYDQFRAEYELREDLIEEANGKAGKVTKHGKSKGTGHIHNMAQRKMVKIFLSHLWAKWREIEGLEVSKPWIIDIGGHSDYIEPPK